MSKTRRVLVTGGAGFIGSALVRSLIADGGEVLNLDKLTYAASLDSLTSVADNPDYRLVQADVADEVAVSRAIADFRPTAIMHLAAESHVDRSIVSAGEFVHTNVVGTYCMLQCALDYWRWLDPASQAEFRFLHVSTDEVYGSLGPTGAFTEATPYDPRSPYSASKAASDHLASAWFHTHGLPVVISNCSNNYGPFHFPEKLIPLAILNCLEGKPVRVYGDGSNVRDWLYVDDHVEALRLIVEQGRPGQTYNVGSRNERTNLEVVQAICDLVDASAPKLATARRSLIEFVDDRPGHDRRYAIDPTKIESELGWRASESFFTGLAKTVQWYLENPGWWSPLRSRYAGERLGFPSTPEESV